MSRTAEIGYCVVSNLERFKPAVSIRPLPHLCGDVVVQVFHSSANSGMLGLNTCSLFFKKKKKKGLIGWLVG